MLVSCKAKVWGYFVDPGFYRIADPVNSSIIMGQTNIPANGVAYSVVTITLLDNQMLPVIGQVPTFNATGAGNIYSSCTPTNFSGISTCTLSSTVIGPKTLSIATPVIKAGNTVNFINQTPSEGNSTISVPQYLIADNSDTGTITVTILDSDNVAVQGVTPTVNATGVNTVSACSATNSSGISNCTITSSEMGSKTLTIGSLSVVGAPAVWATLSTNVYFTEKAMYISVKTDNAGLSLTNQFTLPLVTGTLYNFVAYWGDGSFSEITSDSDGDRIHTYSSSGTYTVKLSPKVSGGMPWLKFGTNDPLKLLTVSSWGSNNWSNMTEMFKNCSNFNLTAPDSPILTSVTSVQSMFENAILFDANLGAWTMNSITNMKAMFKGAKLFNNGGSDGIKDWNTSAVTDMSEMFSAAGIDFTVLFPAAFNEMIFNQPLTNWSTGNVTSIFRMFAGASSFNQNISHFETHKITNMTGLFYWAKAFNQNLPTVGNRWNTSIVTNMEQIFMRAHAFNGNINNWNISNVTSFKRAFAYALTFNQNISGWTLNTISSVTLYEAFYGASTFDQNVGLWNTIKVNNMYRTFANATSFDQNLSSWNLSAVSGINMVSLFLGATSFNNGNDPGIGYWDISNVTSLASVFSSATNFNQPLNGWNTSKVTSLDSTFMNATVFNQDLGSWDTSKVTTLRRTFYAAKAFNNGGTDSIKNWNTSNVDSMYATFWEAYVFNQPINTNGVRWNTAKVTNMYAMFFSASAFNQNLNNWDISKVTNTASMFYNAVVFNGQISNWNTALVSTMSRMFIGARAFNQPINTSGNIWNTSNVTDMSRMFEDCWVFNQSISNWNTSKVTNMYNMFNTAKVFNQDISSWNTGLVTKMDGMFKNAFAFNQNLGSWNTANVTDMSFMFYIASNFNNGVGASLNWNTAKVANMSYMFGYASVFNKPLIFSNTANVTNMSGMFASATIFNQNISGWNTSKVTNMNSMFENASAFNQDISMWNVNLVNQYTSFDAATNVGWIASEKPIWVLAPSGTNKKIFITATSYDGNLGGITGADAKCMADANYPGNGTYKALLGGTTRKVLPSASSWVLIGGANYLRANDSTLVVTALSNKTFGFIMNPFSALGDFFWAGLDETAWTVSADNCTDWTSNDVSTLGEASTITNWTMSLLSCDTFKPLLCVEQ